MADDLRQKILDYLKGVDKAKTKDIAVALNEKKSDVDKIVKDLAKEGIIEFLYIGTSYVKLK